MKKLSKQEYLKKRYTLRFCILQVSEEYKQVANLQKFLNTVVQDFPWHLIKSEESISKIFSVVIDL